jgi:hypothetical protein
MLAVNILSLYTSIRMFKMLKRDINVKHPSMYDMWIADQLNANKHDMFIWMLVIAAFSSTMFFKDYYIATMIILTLYFELEVFKIAKQTAHNGQHVKSN